MAVGGTVIMIRQVLIMATKRLVWESRKVRRGEKERSDVG